MDPEEEECHTLFMDKMLLLVFIKSFPAILCVPFTIVRFFAVKNMAEAQERRYSKLMKMKLTFTFGMSLFYIVPIIFTFAVTNFWIYKACNNSDKYWSLYYLLYCLVWGSLGFLMRYEHSKNLYEVWYC
jgi:cytochrome c biogenesis factor